MGGLNHSLFFAAKNGMSRPHIQHARTPATGPPPRPTRTTPDNRLVARPKNQTARREQLIAAAKRAIAARGLTGLRIKDVARECGLSAGSVAYYFPDLDDLVKDVHRDAVDRFYWARLRHIDPDDPPTRRLRVLIDSGVVQSSDDVDFQVLNELHVHAFRDPFHARLMADLFEREVSLYVPTLQIGAATGFFTLCADAGDVARNLVALEDAYGLHVLGGTHLSTGDVRRLITVAAEAMVGASLGDGVAHRGAPLATDADRTRPLRS